MDYAVPTSRTPSVIMGRHLDDKQMPKPLPDSLVQRLNRNGIERVVVGHTPHGDCPTVLRHTVDSQADQRAEAETHECKLDLIMADTSYSDGRAGDDRGNAISTVSLLPNGETRVGGLRHDGSRIEYSLGFDGSGDPLVGKPVKAGVLRHDGKRFFVKAEMVGGEYLLCNVEGFAYTYEMLPKEETEMAVLNPPSAMATGRGGKARRRSVAYAPTGEEVMIGQDDLFETSREQVGLLPSAADCC